MRRSQASNSSSMHARIAFLWRVRAARPIAGHVPGAINYPFDENLDVDGTFMPPEALRENYQALLKGKPAWQVLHMSALASPPATTFWRWKSPAFPVHGFTPARGASGSPILPAP